MQLLFFIFKGILKARAMLSSRMAHFVVADLICVCGEWESGRDITQRSFVETFRTP